MTTILHPDHAPAADLSEPAKSREAAKSRAARRAGGLTDRAIAWLFVSPTILLPLRFVGLDNFRDILTDEDIWARLQTTAQFVIASVALQVFVGFGLALLINRQFRS